MLVTPDQMKNFSMLGNRVLFRVPGSKEKPEYLPGVVAKYDTKTHKATIVAWKPEGYNITCSGVPYEPTMELAVKNLGCWCLISDLELESPKEENKEKQPEQETQSVS